MSENIKKELNEKLLQINRNKINFQVYIIHSEINKKDNAIITQFRKNLLDEKEVVFRMFELAELTNIGVDQFMELIRQCFVNKLKVTITEAVREVLDKIPTMPKVKIYDTFGEAMKKSSEK